MRKHLTQSVAPDPQRSSWRLREAQTSEVRKTSRDVGYSPAYTRWLLQCLVGTFATVLGGPEFTESRGMTVSKAGEMSEF